MDETGACEKNIGNYIVWDLVNAIKANGYHDFSETLAFGYRNITQKYKKYRLAVNIFDNFYNRVTNIIRPSGVAGKILFNDGGRYASLAKNLKKTCPVVKTVMGKKDRISAVIGRSEYFPVNEEVSLIDDYFLAGDESRLRDLVSQLTLRLEKLAPRCVVLAGDFLPIDRAMVRAAKNNGIPSIIIQHGTFQSAEVFPEGKYADHILVWGQFFKEMYMTKTGKLAGAVHILGYPHPIKPENYRDSKKRIAVYYLGQNFEKYDKSLLAIKLETLKDLNKVCQRLDMEFIYRPHPGDDIKLLRAGLPEIRFSPENETLSEGIEKGDVFISFNSTALIGAGIRSKITLQLFNYPVTSDNYEKIGACSRTFDNIGQVENYLETISKNPQSIDKEKRGVSRYYAESGLYPEQRFLKILKDIEKNKP